MHQHKLRADLQYPVLEITRFPSGKSTSPNCQRGAKMILWCTAKRLHDLSRRLLSTCIVCSRSRRVCKWVVYHCCAVLGDFTTKPLWRYLIPRPRTPLKIAASGGRSQQSASYRSKVYTTRHMRVGASLGQSVPRGHATLGSIMRLAVECLRRRCTLRPWRPLQYTDDHCDPGKEWLEYIAIHEWSPEW